MKESYEEMLFKYGISCAENLLYLGKITKEDYDQLMDYNKRKEVPSREFVERVLSSAVERIGNEKTAEAVERYFREKHNALIDRREGSYAIMPDPLCELCKYVEGVVMEIEDNRGVGFPIYRIKTEDGEDIAFGKYFSGFVVGDRISIHNKSAVRKLN